MLIFSSTFLKILYTSTRTEHSQSYIFIPENVFKMENLKLENKLRYILMFNYNPSLPHQTEAKHNVLQAVSARFPSLSAQISFELDLFAAQSEELNLCWEFHANTDYTGAVAERLEGIQTHFDTVLENLLQISEEIQSITLELVDLNLLQPGVGIRGSYEELQILLTEQIQIVEEAQELQMRLWEN